MKLKFELSILDVEFQNNKIKSDTKEKKLTLLLNVIVSRLKKLNRKINSV